MATTNLGRVVPLHRREYSSTTEYEINDIVSYNGSTYWHFSHNKTTGVLPTNTSAWTPVINMADAAQYIARAETAALQAEGYAGDAQSAKTDAVSAKQDALASEENARSYMTASQTAKGQAESASDIAIQAKDTAVSAKTAAETAKTDAQTASTNAGTSATNAAQSKSDAEAYAVGKRNGVDVPSTDPAYENNAKYYASHTGGDTNAVRFVEQALTEQEKAQARQNINASAPDGYYGTSGGVYQYSTNFLGKNSPQNAHDMTFRPTASNFSGTDWVRDSISGQTATIEKIKGKTLVWNQIYDVSEITIHQQSGVYVTQNGSFFSITTDNTGATDRVDAVRLNISSICISGHKYLLTGSPSTATSSTAHLREWEFGAMDVGNGVFFTRGLGNDYIYIRVNASTVITTPMVFKPQLIDLTQMYGAGNEPATVEEFKAQFPLDYYAYNTGGLISLNATGLKTVGFNQLDEDGHIQVLKDMVYKIEGTYTSLKDSAGNDVTVTNSEFTPTANDTYTMVGGSCVHLKWSGVRDGDTEEHWDSTLSLLIATYFPDGMKSTDTAYDELTKDKAVKRIGKVNLGTLNWISRNYGGSQCFSTDQLGGFVRTVVCAEYPLKSTPSTSSMTEDKMIFYGHPSGGLVIRDSAYTTAQAFKTAMSGVYLYYELATPVETPINPPLNLTYRCDDFGTEMVLPQNDDEPVTTPMDADIIYQLDYEANVRNSDQLNITKESMDNFIAAFNASSLGTITQTWDATNKKYTYTVTPPAEPEPVEP